MHNENEKRNIAVSQKGNAIQLAALNIHQLFPSRTKDECLVELKKNPPYSPVLNPGSPATNFSISAFTKAGLSALELCPASLTQVSGRCSPAAHIGL